MTSKASSLKSSFSTHICPVHRVVLVLDYIELVSHCDHLVVRSRNFFDKDDEGQGDGKDGGLEVYMATMLATMSLFTLFLAMREAPPT